MSAPPSDSDPRSDDDGDLDDENLEDLDDLGDTDLSGEAASDPEKARREAEDALSEIEALADLDEDPDVDTGGKNAQTESTTGPSPSSPPGAEDSAGDPSAAEQETEAPDEQCANCGAPLHGEYCSECGQKNAERIVPLWHMLNDVLEAVFQLDLRLFRTLPKFLFLPGRLTKEYVNGRRKRYVAPFRLYLVTTFLLFATIAFTTTGNFGFELDPQGRARFNPPETAIGGSRSPDTTAASDKSASIFGRPEQRKEMAEKVRSDSAIVDIELYNDPEANTRLERVLRGKVAQAIEDPWEAVGSMIDRGPYLMFILLPIFAFLLKILYIRRGRFYIEHLIFSMHVHALAFLAFTIAILLEQASAEWLNAAAPWIEVSPFFYLVLGMSHVYDQGLIKSTTKAFLLLSVYGIVLLIGFLVLLFIAVWFM
jgi:hypothetical protein